MALGRLTLVPSDWNADTKAWKLPKLQALSVEALRELNLRVDESKWKVDTDGEHTFLCWLSDDEPPVTPLATVRFNESSVRSRLSDPAILAPVLAFLGVITGAFIQSRTQLITTKITVSQSQTLADISSKAKIIGCTGGLDGLPGVSKCLEDWTSKSDQNAHLLKQLTQQEDRNSQLQGSYDSLRSAFQQNCHN